MKVLIIRFSSIGDIVLTSPVLRCLKAQVPGVELHYATKAAFADLLRFSPHVDRVHELGDDLGAFARKLKAEGFSVVVDLHHNLRSAKVKRTLGVPAYSVDKHNVRKWLLVNFKRNGAAVPHIVTRYLDTVAPLGVHDDGLGLELHIPAERTVPLEDLPAPHQQGYAVLAIGAAHATKRLPLHRLQELAGMVEGPLVLTGGPEDRDAGRSLASRIGGRVFDATGRYDLLGSASLIRGARVVIAHDSGAMHMACAFQRPVVSVWGSTVPAFGMGPYMPAHPERTMAAEVQGLSCRPCSKIGHDRCPKGHFHCMERQDLGAIAKWANVAGG